METSKSVEDVNYGLGFNDVHFSDRVLRLEIEPSLFTDFEVETLNVSSLMLAAKSPFFYKLFKNGMKESQKNAEFTLRIDASEKAAFMDLLNFVYHKPLNARSRDELMAVLMVADKFEITSCTKHCAKLLLKSPMTIESALFYLECPSIVFVSKVTRPIIDVAKKILSSHFSNFTESRQEEAMSLTLNGIEVVFGSAHFQVKQEEALLDFMLNWARKHYPDLEERRDILTNRLFGFICLPCLSSLKLIEMANCPDFDSEQVAKLVFNALFYKIEPRQGPNSTPTFRTLFANNIQFNCSLERCRCNHRRIVLFKTRPSQSFKRLY